MKYIIEIEDEPLVRKSALHGEDAVYRAIGFKSLVFDQTGLEKLKPYNPDDDKRSYSLGLDDAWTLAQELDKVDSLEWEDIFDESYNPGDLSLYSYSDAFEKMQKYKDNKRKFEIERKMLDEFCDKTGYSINELSKIIKRVQNDA